LLARDCEPSCRRSSVDAAASSRLGCAPENQVRRRLFAGGRWVRTVGPFT